jgi:hypothetical protein
MEDVRTWALPTILHTLNGEEFRASQNPNPCVKDAMPPMAKQKCIMLCPSSLLGILVIAVAVRFYARHLKNNPLLADDWLLIPALLRLSILAINMELVLAKFNPAAGFIGVCSCIYFGR